MQNLINRTITGFLLVAAFCAIYFVLPPIFFSTALLIILIFILAFEWPQFKHIVGYPLPIVPFFLMIALNQDTRYHHLILPLFLIVALFDTGSYLVGSAIGKHRIAPKISPKKSWEGVIGGYLLATAGLSLFVLQQGERDLATLALISAITCLLALLGDLFESWLKRRAGIKDSGTLLAGHGGLLDRFDGIMVASFFFYFCADWLTSFLSH